MTAEAGYGDVWPEEGKLLTIHPGRQSQAGVLSKRRDDRGEDQSYEDETCRKDNLRDDKVKAVTYLLISLDQPLLLCTWATKSLWLLTAWWNLFINRAWNCFTIRLAPFTCREPFPALLSGALSSADGEKIPRWDTAQKLLHVGEVDINYTDAEVARAKKFRWGCPAWRQFKFFFIFFIFKIHINNTKGGSFVPYWQAATILL